MRDRYIVETSLDGVHRIWDTKEEASVFMSNGKVEDVEQMARNLNDNECAFCHEQCDEAHAQTRYGRVCEQCADERLDENGELRDEG